MDSNATNSSSEPRGHISKPEQEELTPGEKVYLNDLALENILQHICDPKDIVHLQRVSDRFRNILDGLRGEVRTLSILRVASNEDHLKIIYNKRERYLKIPNQELNRTHFDKIVGFIPKDEIKSVKRVIIRGNQCHLQDPYRDADMLEVDGDLGTLLDQFPELKYLELSSVEFKDKRLGATENAQFIKRLTTLMILDCELNYHEVEKLVGSNVITFRVTHNMISYINNFGTVHNFYTMVENIKNLTLYMDKKNWERKYSREELCDTYSAHHIVPWHLQYEKTISFKGDHFVPIRHRKDLRYLRLSKLCREVDEDIVLRTLAEVPYLPRLEKLSFDGYFTRKEIKKFVKVLKKCERLVSLELRKRQYTENDHDWVFLIENLPKGLLCVKLDRLESEEHIAALYSSSSKSLLNLEFRLRNDFSRDAQIFVYSFFSKLRYLRLKVHKLEKNITYLKTSKIPRIDFCSSNLKAVPRLTEKMKKHYPFVYHLNLGADRQHWTLSKNPIERST